MISGLDLLTDFAPFADPATDPTVRESNQTVDLSIIREGEEVRFTVDRSSGRVILRGNPDRHYLTTSTLLAEPLFANIRALATMQRRILSSIAEETFIEAEGTITFVDGAVVPLTLVSLDNVLRTTAGLTDEKIRVVLLDGQAGVGKTSLIQRLVVRRAAQTVFPPIVHLVSRGSRLFSLTQLLAASLDMLRAKFTFDQAPVLIRHGLIQVAIDGFDELVDSEGYADSWSALADFIKDIRNGGGLILAGRDTFFDQQIFNDRLLDLSKSIGLVGARLRPVRPSQARDYLTDHGWRAEELSREPGPDIICEGSYALRPYFLSTLAKATPKNWETLLNGRNIRSYLVDKFVEREANLVRQKTGLSEKVTVDRLYQIFAELAVEMASSESNSVDATFIELVVETTFCNDISSIDLGRLKYKSGSFGFLEADVQKGYRRFPHTEISNHFLAYGILTSFNHSMIRRALRRATMEADLLSIFSELFLEIPETTSAEFTSTIDDLLSATSSSNDRFEANIAALAIATLNRQTNSASRVIADVQIIDGAIVGTVVNATLRRVNANRFDVRGSDLRELKFDDCSFYTMIVDDSTQFGSTRPRVTHLQAVDDNAIVNLRGRDIENWMTKHSESGPELPSEAEALLHRVLSILSRRFAIRDSQDDPAGRFIQHEKWAEIEAVLQKHDRVLRDEKRGAAGPNDSFIRIRDPLSLLKNRDPIAKRIWQEVHALG